ncbi:MAG: hypothetical protein CFE28_12930 [Alphaproteobacteria bacterium PA2]|nr:MAG: hypothetical protein CFE28_12930 [Alphaproteobacteria bacterium PA2]
MPSLKSRIQVRAAPAIGILILMLCSGFPVAASEVRASGLRVSGGVVTVRSPAMRVAAPAGFRSTGPHSFTKSEDNGYHFDVSLVSYVTPGQVISVVAERLVEDVPLNYDDLAPASWPGPSFLARASGCVSMTSAAAAAMPAESGMAEILKAGFNPNGSFAFETALLLAPDRRHEASIELISRVPSCDDAGNVQAVLADLKGRIRVRKTGAAG